MQRALYALMALFTLCLGASVPAGAQGGDRQETEPSHSATSVEIPVTAPSQPPSLDASGPEASKADTIVVAPNETVDNLVLRGRTLILAGHVRHDVVAVNSHVIVKPGATVGNAIDLIGGDVVNQAGSSVRIRRYTPEVAGMLDTFPSSASASPHRAPASHPVAGSWPAAQCALLALGLLVGLVVHLITPNAARQTTDVAASDPGRSLAFGLLGSFLMLPGLLFGGLLLRSIFGLFVAPFVAAFALACAGLVAYGWVCGMAEVGFLIQRKIGVRTNHWFARAAFGLGGFFAFNLVAGSLWRGFGACGLICEGIVALMGLGAILTSGFGSDPHWMRSRLHKETAWLGRTSRL